jgi:hypothetical protein
MVSADMKKLKALDSFQISRLDFRLKNRDCEKSFGVDEHG